MNLDKIKFYAEKKRITIKNLALMSDISESNLHRCIREGKIAAETLEKISKALNVSVVEFFDESSTTLNIRDIQVNESNQGKVVFNETTANDTDTIAHLRKIIALYETIHPDLKEIG